MAAFTGLHLQFDLFGLAITHHPKRLTGFHRIQNGDESFSDMVFTGQLADQIFLTGLTGGHEDKRATCFGRQNSSLLLNGLSCSLDQLPEILEQNMAGAQIRRHHSRTIKLAEGAAKAKPVKSVKNPNDMLTVTV